MFSEYSFKILKTTWEKDFLAWKKNINWSCQNEQDKKNAKNPSKNAETDPWKLIWIQNIQLQIQVIPSEIPTVPVKKVVFRMNFQYGTKA